MNTENNAPQDPWFMTLIFMGVFYVVYLLLGYVLFIIGALQLLIKLLSGQPQEDLQRFGDQMGTYLSQITRYIAMRTDEKPYPFNDWPKESSK